MSDDPSVTTWIALLRAGDAAAAQPLWERYFARLVAFARGKLQGVSRRAADEEDVALSAFHSFCQAARHFPRLNDRDDLWQVLVMLTARKAINLIERECSQKRGGGRVVPAVARRATQGGSEADALAALPAPGPTPEFAAEVAEECRRRLDALGDDELRGVVVDKMEGYTNEEIAARRGWSLGKVERKLRLIRKTWEREAHA